MIVRCPVCLADREKKDFFGKKECFRCVYRMKIIILRKVKKKARCKICKKIVAGDRRSYCSENCANIGADFHKRHHWTKGVAYVYF